MRRWNRYDFSRPVEQLFKEKRRQDVDTKNDIQVPSQGLGGEVME